MLDLLVKVLEKIAAWDKTTETEKADVLPSPQECIQLTLPLD